MVVGSEFKKAFVAFILKISLAIHDPRPRKRVPDMAIGLLCAHGPKTITSALSWLDRSDQDWSSDYRLLSQSKWATEDLFAPIIHDTLELCLDPTTYVISASDDTILRKTGLKIPGTAYARDPLSPPFHVNLVLGQRFVQTALMIKAPGPERMYRSIPVGFEHAPPVKVPRRATEEQRRQVKEARKRHNVSVVASKELHRLRDEIDHHPGGCDRHLIHSVDGGYANKTFLRAVPRNTTIVARVRKDARFRQPLDPCQRGGRRKYGSTLPTPEQMLHDETIPWQPMEVFVAQKTHTLHYKVIDRVCWQKVTQEKPLRLIVIKPAGYRLRKSSKLLYRQPAYLISTSTDVDTRDLIQAYLARWEIEVNFRDEKSILGVGEAQVRNLLSVKRTPAFIVAVYACLLLANMVALNDRRTQAFDALPSWRRDIPLRPSTRDLIALLRQQLAQEQQISLKDVA